jgi:hypothetical protein
MTASIYKDSLSNNERQKKDKKTRPRAVIIRFQTASKTEKMKKTATSILLSIIIHFCFGQTEFTFNKGGT